MYLLGTALLFVAAGALIAFPFLYHWQTRGAWRDDSVGVHLMFFMGALGLVMVFAVANAVGLILHPAPAVCANAASVLPGWVRPLVWFLIASVSWWRVAVLFQVQRED